MTSYDAPPRAATPTTGPVVPWTAVRLHEHEADRLESLRSYGVLDTTPDPRFDALAELAARVCGTPVASVMLVDEDRAWSVGAAGIEITETARSESFCSDVVAAEKPVIVPDTTKVPRYAVNPAVCGPAHVRAYAGVPIVGRDGLPLGAVCAIDTTARDFSAEEIRLLQNLAEQAAVLLELNRTSARYGFSLAASHADAADPRRLRQALDRGELVPHYQPVVHMPTRAVRSYEALLRWEHPTDGTILPWQFLPAIEASELVLPVGRMVLDHACATAAALQARPGGRDDGRVAVNVSAVQLSRPGFSRDVEAALSRHGIDGSSLIVELTESSPLADTAVAQWELQAIRELGADIAFDDFGAGWSNLRRLLELPFTVIKIDRSLVSEALDNIRATRLLDAALRLASGLGLHVVAEGVETEDVARHLMERGCIWAQGWLYGRPLSPSTLDLHEIAA